MKFDTSLPIYRQVVTAIKKDIVSGKSIRETSCRPDGIWLFSTPSTPTPQRRSIRNWSRKASAIPKGDWALL